MEKLPYHTALKNGTIEESVPMQRFVYNNSLAFTYDVFDALPNEFDACDFFYMEPPYPAGSKVFDNRMGIEGRTYSDLAQRISLFIESTNKPIIMTMSKTAIKHLPTPLQGFEADFTHSIKSLKTMVYTWNVKIEEFKTTKHILSELLNEYNCVGDMFCGYGHTAIMAANQSKDFVVSDYNPLCIGFLAKLLGENK